MAGFSHNFTSEAVTMGNTYNVESRCTATKLSISKQNEDYRICHNGTNMVLVVSNDATSDLEGFKFVIFDKDYVNYEFQYLEVLKAGHYKRINITLNETLENISNIEEMRLVPFIMDKEKNIISCPEPAIDTINPSIITNHICD